MSEPVHATEWAPDFGDPETCLNCGDADAWGVEWRPELGRWLSVCPGCRTPGAYYRGAA